MNKYTIIFLIILMFLSFSCQAQNVEMFNNRERECLLIFNNFKSYIINSIEKNRDISDTVEMKYVLLNFILSDYSLDSTDEKHFKEKEVPDKNLKCFKEQLSLFYQFLLERKELAVAKHLAILPVRLSQDKCIYEKLTSLQKENTFIYFDDRHPEHILGYLLFIPKIKDKISSPRIWSWTLTFESGFWAFRSPMGEVGMEYFLSEGVKGPKPDNMIR